MPSNDHNRIQEELTKTVNEIDKSHLRKMQAQMHRCAANCCDNTDASVESVAHCIETCNSSLRSAQSFVQNEFDHFQNRIHRCYMSCNDKIRDKIGPNPTDSEIERYRKELESCSKECDESHITILANMLKRTKEAFNKHNFEVSDL